MERFYSIAALSSIFCALFASSAFADSSCSDITKSFYTYDKDLPRSANNVFPFPWQDITWLQATLGPSSASGNYIQTEAVWKKYDYGVIEVNGKQVRSEGTIPPRVIPASNIAQIGSFIGPPDSSMASNMTENTWTCSDTSSNLTITSNADTQVITAYKGTYCQSSGSGSATGSCQNFSNYKVMFPNYKNIGVGLENAALYVQHPPIQPQYTAMQAPDIASKQTLQSINTQLKSQLTNMAQLQTMATESLINYYSKLSQCVPGTYNYPYPFSLGGQMISSNEVAPYFYFASSKIQGIVNKQCIVVTDAKIGKNNGTVNCKYPVEMLSMFSESRAVSDSTNNANFNPEQEQQAQALLKYCEIFFNGSPLPSSTPAS